MFFVILFILLLFVLLLVVVTIEDGFSGATEDLLKAFDMIREYKKNKRKRKKEG